MKTGSRLGITSKISLLKDLARAFWRKVGLEERDCAEILKLSKSRKSHCCYQTANAVVIMLAGWNAPVKKKRRSGVRSGLTAALFAFFAKARSVQPSFQNENPCPIQKAGETAPSTVRSARKAGPTPQHPEASLELGIAVNLDVV